MIQITNPKKFSCLLFLLLAIVGAGIFKFAWGGGEIKKSGEFQIEEGQGAKRVWAELIEQGYADRMLPLSYHSWRQEAASQLQAGSYQLEAGQSVGEVVARFIAGDVALDEVNITFPEGFTAEQMAERTAAANIGTKEQFIAAAAPDAYREQFPFVDLIPAGRTLEGYLFPDTYRVFADDTPADVIQRMLITFQERVTPDLLEEARLAGRSLDDVIIMASIIEREVIKDEDMALVSGVLWKRYDEGIALGADATVRYVLSKWDGALTVDDLAVDSPYNTRRYAGLPPGPISNPGIRAISAAVRPQESEFYYYLSAPDGETIFSKTNEEHNANKVRYLQ